eukprot:gene16336-22529_t
MIQRLQELPIYFGLSDEEMEEEGPGSSHIWIDKVSPASFQVHSQSKNPYFSDWLEGLLDELTRHYFEDLRVNIKALPKEASKSNNESEGIYTVLEVCTLPGERNFSIYCQEQEALQAHAKESQWGMGAATFYELFPYHIILNNHGKVLQAGDVIRRMFPALAVSGASHISEFFTMQHPTNAEFGFDYLDTCCSGTAAVMLSSQGLLLKGNWCMKELRMRNKDGDGEETVKEVVKLFLGAPYFHNLADVKELRIRNTDREETEEEIVERLFGAPCFHNLAAVKELRMTNNGGEETVNAVVKLFLGAPWIHNLAAVKAMTNPSTPPDFILTPRQPSHNPGSLITPGPQGIPLANPSTPPGAPFLTLAPHHSSPRHPIHNLLAPHHSPPARHCVLLSGSPAT